MERINELHIQWMDIEFAGSLELIRTLYSNIMTNFKFIEEINIRKN